MSNKNQSGYGRTIFHQARGGKVYKPVNKQAAAGSNRKKKSKKKRQNKQNRGVRTLSQKEIQRIYGTTFNVPMNDVPDNELLRRALLVLKYADAALHTADIVTAIGRCFEDDPPSPEEVERVLYDLTGVNTRRRWRYDKISETARFQKKQAGDWDLGKLGAANPPFEDGDWTREEFDVIVDCFPAVKSALHENNPEIHRVARKLGRRVRTVEAQLIMCRRLDDGSTTWGNMNQLIRDAWFDSVVEPGPPDAREHALAEDEEPVPRLVPERAGPRFFGILDRVLERAFGGEDVAEAPGTTADDFWPAVPGAAGAHETIQMLADFLATAGSEEVPRWVILEGGAGNGKSFLARELVRDSGCQLRSPVDHKIADRSYDYKVGNRVGLRVINDATIPGEAKGTGDASCFLVRDFAESLEQGFDLLACVNRGVIVEELAELEKNESVGREDGVKLAAGILRALDLSPDAPIDTQISGSTCSLVERTTEGSTDRYLRVVELLDSSEETLVTIYILDMNYGSILEPRPGGKDGDVTWGGPKVILAPYKLKTFSDHLGVQSPAREALERLLQTIGEVERDSYSPFAANLSTLGEEKARAGLIRLARSAEIASGRRFTFRDWWGVVALAIVGFRNGEFQITGNRVDQIEKWYRARRSACDDRDRRLDALIALSMQRIHMSLFSAQPPRYRLVKDAGRFRAHADAVNSLQMVDPVLDSTGEWARLVHEAMQGVSLDEEPSSYLSDRSAEFSSAWTSFDRHLEEALLYKCRDREATSAERSSLINWYGQYLYRLYGLAVGRPANEQIISMWFQNWSRATHNRGMTADLRSGLEILLFGEGVENGEMLLPLLSSRASPVTIQSRPVIGASIRTSDIRFKLIAAGENLFLDVSDTGGTGGKPIRRSLDYHLCREAWTCRGRNFGFTEQSQLSLPRLERLRATLLTNEYNRREGIPSPRIVIPAGDGRWSELDL